MSWILVGTAVVGAIGANEQRKAGKKAANAANKANDAALAEQEQARLQQQQNITPYLNQGTNALSRLDSLMANPSSFAQDPAYQFIQDQSLQALDRGAAARGRFLSPGTDADRIKLASGLASQEYGNQFNRLYNLASLGQNAAVGAGSAAQASANNIGNLYQNRGQIGADQAINSANANTSYLNTLGQAFGSYMGGRGANTQSGNATSIYNFGNNANDWYTGVNGANLNTTLGNNPFLGRP